MSASAKMKTLKGAPLRRHRAGVEDGSILAVLHYTAHYCGSQFVAYCITSKDAAFSATLVNVNGIIRMIRTVQSEIDRVPILVRIGMTKAEYPSVTGFTDSHLHITVSRNQSLRGSRSRIAPDGRSVLVKLLPETDTPTAFVHSTF
jgi:hypothetical protein